MSEKYVYHVFSEKTQCCVIKKGIQLYTRPDGVGNPIL